ncbi:MAG TPA: Do family serine endopeptidase [Acidobacteriaceae bacterium]|jgi:serine protease Do|nr:Do family serine endopeptidase [Acidobacteriaceae bacterium]
MNLTTIKASLTRRLAIPAVAVGAFLAVGAWALAGPASAAPTPAPAAPAINQNSVAPLLSLDQAMEALTAHVTPAVVNVNVTSKLSAQELAEDEGGGQQDQQEEQEQQQMQQFFGLPFGQGPMQQQQQQPSIEKGEGSGVIISPDGYIVTNNHVVRGAVNISVTLSNRDIYPAKLIGTDPLTDLAVIKINGHDLPSIPWGNSADLHPGEMVLAFGNPYGFQFSVTRGIISALNRPNPEANRYKPGEFIQTDAAINPGNSGGALVDARGQVIGINTFLISPTGAFSGMGFAIPSEIAEPIANELIKDGHVDHGYIGISIENVTPSNAKFFGVQKTTGAVVADVTPDSPGSKAGLKSGDVITQLNGNPVTDAGELQMKTSETQPGTTIHLTVTRDGKTQNLPVTLDSMPNSKTQEIAQNGNGKGRWGMGLATLTPDVRQQIQAPPSVQGAVVEQVRPGSPADDAGLQRGDVIVSIDRKPTPNAADVAQQLSSIPQGQDALVLIWSDGGSTFVVMHPNQG